MPTLEKSTPPLVFGRLQASEKVVKLDCNIGYQRTLIAI